MNTITIYRLPSRYDAGRDYRMLVDGREIARIGDAAWVQIRVPSGARRVQFRIDWCGSPELELDLAPGEDPELVVGTGLYGWRVLLVYYFLIFARSRYLRLLRVPAGTLTQPADCEELDEQEDRAAAA